MKRDVLFIIIFLALCLFGVGTFAEVRADEHKSVQYRSFPFFRNIARESDAAAEKASADADEDVSNEASSEETTDDSAGGRQGSETTSVELTRPEYEPPWERVKWAFNGAGFITNPVDHNRNYEHRGDVCIAGELALCFPMTERDCFGVYVKMGTNDWLSSTVPTFCQFIDVERRFSEAWYEHDSKGGFRYRVGLVDLKLNGFDTNEYASSGFDHFSATGLINDIAWSSPGASFGALAWKDFGERWSIGAAYQCANELRDIFSYGYSMGQVEYHSDFGGRKGNYRAYTWIQNKARLEKTNLGWGCSCDQELTEKLGVWTRLGFQDEDCATVGAQFSGGIALNHIGHKWSWNDAVADDSFGVGCCVTKASRLLKKTVKYKAGAETFLETYYRYGLNEYGHISPYMQFVCSPSGKREAGSIYVLGVRAGFNL